MHAALVDQDAVPVRIEIDIDQLDQLRLQSEFLPRIEQFAQAIVLLLHDRQAI
jgi:hypothetical protein